MSEYLVRTDVYNGPMDLLLYLIKRDEIDIYDIPIAHVTGEYCRYVETLGAVDPNVAGEFLVLATVLMEIKSRTLLPRPVTEDGEPDDWTDPRLELVRQLLEYKKFKDASFELGAAAEAQAARWPRVPAKVQTETPTEVDLDEVQIWDLVAAFNKVLASIGAGAATHDVIFDDTPISLHATDIVDRLQAAGGELSFELIFAGRGKVEVIGLFLAMLELVRQRRIRAMQPADFGAIHIVLLSAEPIEIGDEWDTPVAEAVLGDGGADVADDAVSVASSAGREAIDAASDDGDGPEFEALELDDDELGAEELAELDAIERRVDVDAILKTPERATVSGEDDDGDGDDA